MDFVKNVRYIFAVVIIIIFYFILILVSYNNYRNKVEIIKSEYDAKHKLVEGSIYNTIKYADSMFGLIDQQLTDEMENKSLLLVDKYTKEPDVMAWNIEELKRQIGDYDIYIINEDLRVIRTTFKEDLGLDFSKLPSFSKLLRSRLEDNSFVTDRVDVSTTTGQLMKYSYFPTPDHKYILELSINLEERFPVINELDSFSLAQNLTSQYRSVENIVIYKSHFDGKGILKISKTKPYYQVVMDTKKTELIKKALKSNEVQIVELTNDSSGNSFTHKYIPYVVNTKEGEYSWWNSYVIEVVYNNLIFEELGQQKNAFWKYVALITLVYLTFAFIILYLLLKSEHMAYHDALTNLPNRKLLEKYINQAILGTKKSDFQLAILFLDLNNFKDINDTYGHDVGDQVLKEVSARLTANLRKNDIISRLGGDEFTILLLNIRSGDEITKVVYKINNLFKSPLIVDTHEVFIKCSIGISRYPDDGDESDTLMKKADIAMYHAKNKQLGYVIYNESLQGPL